MNLTCQYAFPFDSANRWKPRLPASYTFLDLPEFLAYRTVAMMSLAVRVLAFSLFLGPSGDPWVACQTESPLDDVNDIWIPPITLEVPILGRKSLIQYPMNLGYPVPIPLKSEGL